MTKIVVEVVFQSWDEAMAARDELRAAGYEVLIADDVVDLYSDAAFAEVYGTVNREAGVVTSLALAAGAVSHAMDAVWNDVERIVEPFGGSADSCALVGDDHVPFEGYRPV
jgi:hypothetical protein